MNGADVFSGPTYVNAGPGDVVLPGAKLRIAVRDNRSNIAGAAATWQARIKAFDENLPGASKTAWVILPYVSDDVRRVAAFHLRTLSTLPPGLTLQQAVRQIETAFPYDLTVFRLTVLGPRDPVTVDQLHTELTAATGEDKKRDEEENKGGPEEWFQRLLDKIKALGVWVVVVLVLVLAIVIGSRSRAAAAAPLS